MRKIKSIVTAAVFAALTLSFYGCNDKGSDSSSSNNVVYYDLSLIHILSGIQGEI